MEIEQIKTLLTQQSEAFEAYKKANDEVIKAKAEGKAFGELETKTQKVEADLTKIQEKLDQLASSITRNTPQGDNTKDSKEYSKLFRKAISGKSKDSAQEIETAAIKAYEEKTLRVESQADGGFLVTPDMNARIVNFLFETSPMRANATVQNTSKSSVQGKYDGEEPDSGWTGETEPRQVTSTPQLGIYEIPVNEIWSQPDITQVMLDDADLDIETWLSDKLSRRFARQENKAFVTGDGIKKPRGFLTYAATPGSDPTTDYKRGNIVQLVSANSGTINFDDIIDLTSCVKTDYLLNSKFYFNRKTLGAVRKLKDTQGQYLWQPSQQAGNPNLLNGYAYEMFEDMPSIAVNSLPIAFGDMAETYTIVDRTGIRILPDPYFRKGFVLFYSTKRVGGGVVNFDSLKLLKVKA